MTVPVEEAQAMRAEGLTLRAIGDHFGVTGERIRQIVGRQLPPATCARCGEPIPSSAHANTRYCSRRCSGRAYGFRHKTPCVDCAEPSLGERCVDCKRRKWETERGQRFDRLAASWKAGKSMAEIAVEFDTTVNALGGLLCRARAAGWDLPLRRAHEPKSENLTKAESRFQFSAAIRDGKIRRPSRCEECGRSGAVDGHHTDYQRPLYVIWLCPPCHNAVHTEPEKAAA